MNNLFTRGMCGKLVLMFMLAGGWHCKGKGRATGVDSVDVAGVDSMHGRGQGTMKPVATTLPDGTFVLMDPVL